MHRNLVLDAMRVIMALMVVAIHAFSIAFTDNAFSFMLLEGVFRMAVPIFLIINGYYFFHALENGHVLGWLKKVFVLYLFWSILYLPTYLPIRHHALRWADIDMGNVAYQLAFGYMQLWYVSAMLCAAGLMALLRRWPAVLAAPLPLAVFLYATGVVIQYLVYYNNLVTTEWPYRNFLFFATPIMLLGYAIRKNEAGASSPTAPRFMLPVGLAMFAVEMACAYHHAPRDRGVDMYFSLFLLSPAIFMLAKNARPTYAGNQLSTISAMIYFSHYAIIWMTSRYLHMEAGWHTYLLAAGGGALLGCCVLYVPQKYRIFV